MARAFSYFMQENAEITDFAIFAAVSETIKNAIQNIYNINNNKTAISKTAFEIALKQLV